MKKITIILLAVLIYGCSSDDESSQENEINNLILGQWTYLSGCESEDFNPSYFYEFYSDGTVSVFLPFDGRGSGTYKITNRTLEMVDDNAEKDDDRYTIESINESNMTWSEIRGGEKQFIEFSRAELCSNFN